MVQATVTIIKLQWRSITFISGMAMMLLLWSSCKDKKWNNSLKKETRDTAINYKQYSLNKVESFSANDAGYNESDSFKIYPFGNRIYFTGAYFVTKTIDSSDYVFLFWVGYPWKIDFETRVSKVDFVKDSILDVNGDNEKDFIFYWQPRNGNCHPLMAEVFISDTVHKSFHKIKEFDQIPYPVFNAKNKKVTSTITCNYKVDNCVYQWKGNKLEEITCKTEKTK